MEKCDCWKRLSGWNYRVEAVIPKGCAEQCRHFFEADRYRVEVLFVEGSPQEVRIPCRPGELWPVGRGLWAWSGPGGHWAQKVIGVLGEDAAGPWGARPEAGTRNDEAVIWFPANRVPDVGQAVGIRRRAHGGNLANFAGAA